MNVEQGLSWWEMLTEKQRFVIECLDQHDTLTVLKLFDRDNISLPQVEVWQWLVYPLWSGMPTLVSVKIPRVLRKWATRRYNRHERKFVLYKGERDTWKVRLADPKEVLVDDHETMVFDAVYAQVLFDT